MQFAKVFSAGIEGVDAFLVEVEVNRAEPRGQTGRTTIVGLPDAAVKESIERIVPAMFHSKILHAGADNVVVNLAPAEKRKEGPAFDLAIALAMGATIDENRLDGRLEGLLFYAELALDGRLRPVRGVLSAALCARANGFKGIVVAPENAAEAAVVSGLTVFAPAHLQELFTSLQAGAPVSWRGELMPVTFANSELDLSDVRGQEHAKRALMVAAAGGHNLLMIGPPGSGKTMLASRLPGILPPLSEEEAIEVTKVHSVAGRLDAVTGLIRERPFRAPHHSISSVGLIGGGAVPRPGEVSLAHHGVLFLDELPEFPRPVLENLRQPLEDGHLTIARAAGHLRFPSRAMLIAAMNPCPCGYLGHPTRACTDNPDAVHRYRGRISGPFLDRIDLHLDVPAQSPDRLDRAQAGPSSAEVRAKVIAARERMIQRQGRANALLSGRRLRQYAVPTAAGKSLLHRAVDELGLSARAHDRILKVALTICDLDQRPEIDDEVISEAIGFRILDRKTR